MAEPNKAEIAKAFARNNWFRRQRPSLQASLIAAAIPIVAEAGRWLYEVGDEAYGLYCVISGTAHIHVQMDEGDYALSNIVGAGAIFGYAGRLARNRRLVTAMVRNEARLLYISQARLEAIARSEPDLWLCFGELAFDHLVAAMRAKIINGREAPEVRVALHLRGLMGDVNEPSQLDITQDELAELTGLSRKTVNQVLGQFAGAGAIEISYRRIDVIDPGKLGRY